DCSRLPYDRRERLLARQEDQECQYEYANQPSGLAQHGLTYLGIDLIERRASGDPGNPLDLLFGEPDILQLLQLARIIHVVVLGAHGVSGWLIRNKTPKAIALRLCR